MCIGQMEDNNGMYNRKLMALGLKLQTNPVSTRHRSDYRNIEIMASKFTKMAGVTSLKHCIPQFTLIFTFIIINVT